MQLIQRFTVQFSLRNSKQPLSNIPQVHFVRTEICGKAVLGVGDKIISHCILIKSTSSRRIDMANDNGLSQMVDKPTRTTSTTSSVLDLFLTNLPDMVNRMEIIPGISDHDIPFLDISTRVRLNKKTPCKIHLYHKGNIDGLTASLSNFSEGCCERYASQESWDVEAVWISFKEAVLHAIDTHIPTKQITSKKQSLPWITQGIKKAIRKRDTLFK